MGESYMKETKAFNIGDICGNAIIHDFFDLNKGCLGRVILFHNGKLSWCMEQYLWERDFDESWFNNFPVEQKIEYGKICYNRLWRF